MSEPDVTRSIAVVAATVEDADRVSELAARTFAETFAADNTPADMAAYLAATFTPERQRAELRDPATRVLLVRIDEVLAGYAQLVRSAAPACVTGSAPIELARFYLDRPWHGRRVARLLMRHVMEEAARHGGETLWLGVWERNARAIAFYRKHGFVDVGSRPFLLGSDVQTDRVMQCPVDLAVPE